MHKLANFIFVLSLAVILLCLGMLGLYSVIEPYNEFLSKFSNVASYLSLLFSAIALLVAALAFKIGTLRPKLRFEIHPWQGEVNKLVLPYNFETNRVDGGRPNTEWYMYLFNDGNATARYPVIEMVFHGPFFSDDHFAGWQATHHENALGWHGFRWSPGQSDVVHPGLPLKIPMMSMNGTYFENTADDPSVQITIVADGCDKKSITVPICLI